MVEITDIEDRESLRDWLKEQPKEVSAWISLRAAMRVLPLYWEWTVASQVANKRDLTALPLLRFYLTSEVVRKMQTSELTATRAHAAARASFPTGFARATHAPFSLLDAADTVADTAARVVLATDAADAAFAAADVDLVFEVAAHAAWRAFRMDREVINKGHDRDNLKLWSDKDDPLFDVWARVKSSLPVSSPSHPPETDHGADPIDWSFWIKWYDDALAGTPPNWKMLERIALIDPADWDKGAEVVNPLIAEIVAEFEADQERAITLVLSRFSSGLFRAIIAVKEIRNGNKIHRRVSA